MIAEQAEKDGLTKDANTAALLELSRLNVLQQALSEKYLKDKKATDQEMRAEYETQVSATAELHSSVARQIATKLRDSAFLLPGGSP